LLAGGTSVLCLDNVSTGSLANIRHLRDHPGFEIRRLDVAQPWPANLGSADIVYHLACPASPRHYQADPVGTIRTAVIGTERALEFTQRHDAALLLASTSEVYGDPEQHPQSEDYLGRSNPTTVRACYSEGKRAAEAMAFSQQRAGTRVAVARVFNSYGPRMGPDDGRVVSTLIVQALRGDLMTIDGDGSQTRSFCFVDDTIAALVGLSGLNPTPSGPVNIGNPDEVTVLELARQVLALTGSTSVLTHRARAADDPRRRCPDIDRVTTLLGWQPAIGLADGLGRTIAYLRDHLGTR